MKRLLVLVLIAFPFVAQATPRALAERMDRVSSQFIGKPYLIDPLGEGPGARFDQDPRLRLDGFDCTTFVETVVSIAKARRSNDVERWMDRIRYANGKVGFETRNHFPDVDWIANNTRARIVTDITRTIDRDALATAEALIEKDSWYALLKIERLSGIAETEKPARLIELRSLGAKHGKTISRVPYLRKHAIVAHPEILERIPHGAIVNVVRPNFDVTKGAGTHMNITHQGFAFHKNGVVYFRHASPTPDPVTGQGKVTEIPLLDYVHGTLPSKTIDGINVLSVR
ncbi:MAG: N-acetylmuramoyl-L-alanine amidase-like domain-containing protein [Bdellovibrionota bacterium]